MKVMNPKVFVSHASEDKERFVLDFATKLRAKGIDAWLDKWEILPGDSLIDKLFEEGIKNAQAVIVVVSNFSVNKPWVREELNAATVKRINGKSKLIPVVIDDCQVPEALQSTVWEKVKDLNSYDAELERIVSAIFEHREKPPIGAPPAYTRSAVSIIPGLTRVDSLVLKLLGEHAITRGHSFGSADGIFEKARALDIDEGNFFESLEILHSRGLIEGHKTVGSGDKIDTFLMTIFGFEEYAKLYVEKYPSIVESVALQIVNHNVTTNSSISSALHQPVMVINHILALFGNNGLIGTSQTIDGTVEIYNVSVELRRRLRRA
jgi:hypothetical protein